MALIRRPFYLIMVANVPNQLVIRTSWPPSEKPPFSDEDLYDLLLPYTLTKEQLRENGYPFCEDGTYKVVHNEAFAFNKKWRLIRAAYERGRRYCVRCGDVYDIDDSETQITPYCTFHSQRKRRSRIMIEATYPCCSGDRGCQTELYHVTERLYDVMDFVVEAAPSEGEVQKKVLALDCEMISTTHGMELAHLVVVDINGETVYDSLCLPSHKVTSYLTEFSGITEEMLAGATKSLFDIQNDLLRIITADTILVGHSLDSDFRALMLSHHRVVDTSVLYPPHEVNGDLRKQSLKRLASEVLGTNIQQSEFGHSAAEDAIAAMNLARKKVGI